MGGVGGIIQFFFFILLILVMAKIFGFADNGIAVIGSVVIGGIAYGLIYFISSKIRAGRPAKNNNNKGNTLKRGNARARKKMDK